MSHPEENNPSVVRSQVQEAAKKPYRKPEFRFEQVFETRALACGKISTTEAQCASNTKTS
jgi:hypothetical protein